MRVCMCGCTLASTFMRMSVCCATISRQEDWAYVGSLSRSLTFVMLPTGFGHGSFSFSVANLSFSRVFRPVLNKQ